MRVLLSGATGLIGRELARQLTARGHEVWGFSRRARSPDGDVARWFVWDTLEGAVPPAAMEGVEAVIHLAGEPIAEKRWSAEHKRRVLESRTKGTTAIVEALRAASPRPRVLLAASAVGIYGNRGDALIDEASPPGPASDFMVEVCTAWERASAPAAELGLRLVQLRIGVVLAKQGGALEKLAPVFRMGIGGRLGDGRQFFPWIHEADVVGLMVHALESEAAQGPLNLVAPGSVTNDQLGKALGRALHRPVLTFVPAFALKLALGEMSTTVLQGQRVSAAKAESLGYRFRFPEIDGALRDLLG